MRGNKGNGQKNLQHVQIKIINVTGNRNNFY